MLAYEQLHIPPERQRKGCCQECSLCCCRCCLGTSVVFAIIFAVAGGLLIYAFREDSYDQISVSIGYYSADYQYSFVMRTLGYALIVFGAIMFICIFVSASFVCCLTPTDTNQSRTIIVNVSANKFFLHFLWK
ncbi:unnamed protein product [Hymenolepis diminuta]|uniref:Uncharacterized protein n=1 Tax=Hymenolepis diminuta TaxID=6216 RepID=A0A0R3S873_HYMDI|nr:unnamed protein product [Hymenolepis diminuta]